MLTLCELIQPRHIQKNHDMTSRKMNKSSSHEFNFLYSLSSTLSIITIQIPSKCKKKLIFLHNLSSFWNVSSFPRISKYIQKCMVKSFLYTYLLRLRHKVLTIFEGHKNIKQIFVFP